MNQIYLNNNLLLIKVKKTPLIIRIVLFIFTFLFFLFPLAWIASLFIGKQLTVVAIILTGIFLFSGVYLLRLTLWNTYGEEKIYINPTKLTYEVSYGWFKDRVREVETLNLDYYIKPHPSGDDIGVLAMRSGTTEIESVIPLKSILLEDLIVNLKNLKS